MEIAKIEINHNNDTGYYICNGCGEIINRMESSRFMHQFGYGSKYDMDKIDMVLCNDCLDKIADMISKYCVISPIIGH